MYLRKDLMLCMEQSVAIETRNDASDTQVIDDMGNGVITAVVTGWNWIVN